LFDTIAAIATGGVVSAVGIIRISGSNALTVADNVFFAANCMSLKDAENRRLYFGELRRTDVTGENVTGGRFCHILDTCLCMVSRAPSSYTGEDTVEFQCHGSPIVLSEILQVLFALGVRQALPGEFTKRAFLNGKIDLTQAEAVIDLIEAETPAAAQNAAGQLSGAVRAKMETIYSRLLDMTAHFHAVIDYPDEDIEDFRVREYIVILNDITDELMKLHESFKRGNILRGGIPTAIIGRPNTGKSSLLNALLGYERAIVTDVAGTTRDTIEEKVVIGNVLLRLIDTAGLRKTNDTVEKLGVDRTLAVISDASLVLLVLDGSEPLKSEDFDILHSIPPDIPKIAVVNKSDLPAAMSIMALNELGVSNCKVSALSGEGLDSLDAQIKNLFPIGEQSAPYGEIITNARQADALFRALASITSASRSLADNMTADAIVTDIESTLAAIGEITGKTIREDIVGRIFERFCVGK